MATLTKLESKLAEVLGLAMAAQDAVREVRGMLGPEHEALASKLDQARKDARETQERCTALAAAFKGKKTAMAEAGEVGHWSIVAKLNEKAGNAELRELTAWALPIQQRHLQEVLDGSLKLAAAEDPGAEA